MSYCERLGLSMEDEGSLCSWFSDVLQFLSSIPIPSAALNETLEDSGDIVDWYLNYPCSRVANEMIYNEWWAALYGHSAGKVKLQLFRCIPNKCQLREILHNKAIISDVDVGLPRNITI